MKLMEDVARFAYPRGSGGDGERRAGDQVAEELRAAGLEVRTEPFTASRSAVHRLRLIAHGLAAATVATVGALAGSQPGTAALLAITGLALAGASARWNVRFEGAFDVGPMIRSANVEGIRAGAGARTARLVILAHRDTKSSAWPTLVPAVVVVLAGAYLFAIAIWSAVAAVTGIGIEGPVVAVTGFLLAAALLVTAVNPSGDASPGAMDNASGLAVLLAAARRLPQDEKLRDVQLHFLCTGAEEAGLAGAMRWIRLHAGELDEKRTVFVNLDSVGVGVRMLAADVRGRAPDGTSMRDVVRAAARESGVSLAMMRMLPAAGVDTMPISARGFPTVTLLGDVTGRAALRIHTHRDTVDHLHEAGLRNALRLVERLARRIAREAP